jgi:hypothetical protein
LVAFEELALTPHEGPVTADTVCHAIHATNARLGIQPIWYVLDPASRNRAHQTGRSDQYEYAKHGIVAVPGQNAHKAGFNAVKERLESHRLQITANCSTLIQQIQEYRWASPKQGEGDAPEKPIRRNDHLVDALRYVVMSEPSFRAPPSEPEVERPDVFRVMAKRHRETQLGGVFL